MKFLKNSVLAVTAAAMLMATSTQSAAAVISLNALLTNGSFEGGVAGSCPTGWSCANVGVTNQNFAADYPGSNGLSSGYVPDGAFAAFTPVTGANGTLSQTLSGETFEAGNSYVLDFWVGNPLGGLFPNRIDVLLTAGAFNSAQTNTLCDTAGRFATLDSGSQHGNDSGTACQFSLTDFSSGLWQPADGDWRRYTLTFTTNANIVGDIGVRFNVFPQQSAENGALVHLDLPGPAPDLQSVPEPALLAMMGFGLAALGARLRASRRTS